MLKHSLRIIVLAGLAAVLVGGPPGLTGLVPADAMGQTRYDDNGRPLPARPETGEVKGLLEYIVEDATPIADIYCDVRDVCAFVWEWATTPFLEGVIKMGAELEKNPPRTANTGPVAPFSPGPVAPMNPVPAPRATPTPPADVETAGAADAPPRDPGTPRPVLGPPNGDPGRDDVYITLDGEILDLHEILELGDPNEENDAAPAAGKDDETNDQAQYSNPPAHDTAMMSVISNVAMNPAVLSRPPVQVHPSPPSYRY